MTETKTPPPARRQPRLHEEGTARALQEPTSTSGSSSSSSAVHVHPVSWELMGEGRKLADKLGVDLAAVRDRRARRGAERRGRRSVRAMAPTSPMSSPNPVLTDYRNEPYTKAMTDLVNTYKPEILLLGATNARPRSRRLGRDHAAHRPHRRLHRARRRRRRLAGRDAPDLRRLAAVHDLHAELPAADGDGAPARDVDARSRRDEPHRPHRRASRST